MADIPPHLAALAHKLHDALCQARQRRDKHTAASQAQASLLVIPPLSKAQQDELHAELERLIEAELKRS